MKTACLSFCCPSCNTNYELFLRTSPHVIILNCPSCKKIVSLYNGKIRSIDKKLIKKLQHVKNEKEIKNIFNNIDQSTIKRDSYITKDDVINLIIDLNVCKSVNEFLLCQT